MLKLSFADCEKNSSEPSTYVIIGARYRDKWLFVKNRKRKSYEMPAGHVDKDESDFMAAGRELMEESGAKKFMLECVNTYYVDSDRGRQTGSLYYAYVMEIGDIEDQDEIEECMASGELPENLTFPEVQASLFKRVKEHVLK